MQSSCNLLIQLSLQLIYSQRKAGFGLSADHPDSELMKADRYGNQRADEWSDCAKTVWSVGQNLAGISSDYNDIPNSDAGLSLAC